MLKSTFRFRTFAVTRRRFLQLAAGSFGWLVACRREERIPVSRELPLGPIGRLSGPITLFDIENVAVLRDDRGLAAISSICTHQRCPLTPEPGAFHCPCHGSRFDWHGEALNGPAREPLPFYELRLDEHGNLYVDKGKRVRPDWRLPVT